jgi:Ring finger domain
MGDRTYFMNPGDDERLTGVIPDPSRIEKGDICGICQDLLIPDDPQEPLPIQLPCGHVWHLECVRRWLMEWKKAYLYSCRKAYRIETFEEYDGEEETEVYCGDQWRLVVECEIVATRPAVGIYYRGLLSILRRISKSCNINRNIQ